MPGLADAAAAFRLDLVVPGDVQPVPGTAAGGQLPGFDPVVDDAGAAAELAGGFGDADLAAVGSGERGCRERAGAGGPAQVGGLGDPGAAAGLGPGAPGDAEPAGGAAAGGQLPGADPVVDDAGAAAQLPGGLGHGDLAGAVGIRDRDLVGVADPLDRIDVEWPVVASAVPGGIEPGDQLVVAGGRPEPSDELDGGGRGTPGGAGVDGPVGGELVGGAGVPADPDPYFAAVGAGEQGDVGDQGAQQPFAVPGAGGGRIPQGGQVSGEFLQVVPAGQRRQRVLGGLQRLLSLGEGGEPGLPAGLQGTGDQPVFRLDGAEGPLGPVSVVAGTFHRELGGPADPLMPARDLIGGRQRQGDLPGGQRVQQRARDRGVHAGRGDRPARRRGQPVPARAALIGGPLIGVVVGHYRFAAAAAADDPLAQRGALPRRPGTGGGVVGRQPRLAGQVLRPGDVALVVVFDQHRPFGAGPFGDRGMHRAGRVDGAAGGVAA